MIGRRPGEALGQPGAPRQDEVEVLLFFRRQQIEQERAETGRVERCSDKRRVG
jgi:hypothetical protein